MISGLRRFHASKAQAGGPGAQRGDRAEQAEDIDKGRL